MTMPRWLYGVACPSINAVSWRLAAFLSAPVALLALHLTQRYVDVPAASTAPQPPVPMATQAITKPAVDDQAVDRPAAGQSIATPAPGGQLDRLIRYCSTLVTPDRSFVLFSNGTCVIVTEPCDDPVAQARETLAQCARPDAPFVTKEVENQNFLVTYQGPAFHCLFSDEIARARRSIEDGYGRYLGEAERKALHPDHELPFRAKLGLVGRSRLYADARAPEIARIIKARTARSSEGPESFRRRSTATTEG